MPPKPPRTKEETPRIVSASLPKHITREHCTVNGEGRDIYDYDDAEYGRHLEHMEESLFHKRVVKEEINEDQDKESE